MRYSQIYCYNLINDVEEDKVNAIAESMKKDGYVGCPILIYGESLLTGSHRLAALRKLEEEGVDVYDWEVAEDVTDLVEDAFQRFEEKHGWMRDMDYSDIGWILKGTWVEKYKDEIVEW